jgi:DNA-binding transcriptional ArsR family regulator
LSSARLTLVLDLDVIADPAAAITALDPLRARLLAELHEAASAAVLAAKVGLPRQKVNYHLRSLEEHGLVTQVGERKRGGLTERLLQATAASYVVSPAAMAEAGSRPERVTDRLSARYLIAVAARLVREVGEQVRGADEAGKPLPTLTLDAEVRFRSAAERAEFTEQLTAAVTDLVARFHDEGAEEGRWHRLVVGAHPIPPPGPTEATAPSEEDTP